MKIFDTESKRSVVIMLVAATALTVVGGGNPLTGMEKSEKFVKAFLTPVKYESNATACEAAAIKKSGAPNTAIVTIYSQAATSTGHWLTYMSVDDIDGKRLLNCYTDPDHNVTDLVVRKN